MKFSTADSISVLSSSRHHRRQQPTTPHHHQLHTPPELPPLLPPTLFSIVPVHSVTTFPVTLINTAATYYFDVC